MSKRGTLNRSISKPKSKFKSHFTTLRQLTGSLPFNKRIDTNTIYHWGDIDELSPEECKKALVVSTKEGIEDILPHTENLHNANYANGINPDVPPDLITEINGYGCSVVVLGLNKDLYRYFQHNQEYKDPAGNSPFTLLAVPDKVWTPELNENYINCAIRGELASSCPSPIFILLPKQEYIANLTKLKNEQYMPTITAREIQYITQLQLATSRVDRFKYSKYDTSSDYSYDIIMLDNDKLDNDKLDNDKLDKEDIVIVMKAV
jgi:hypothetical protein